MPSIFLTFLKNGFHENHVWLIIMGIFRLIYHIRTLQVVNQIMLKINIKILKAGKTGFEFCACET